MKIIKGSRKYNCKSKKKKKPKSRNLESRNVLYAFILEKIEDLNKKQRQEMINKKIREREHLYKIQADKLSKVQSREVERLNKQIEELQKKEQEI